MLRRTDSKRPRVTKKTIDNEVITRVLVENEETKTLEDEVKDDEAIAKMVQDDEVDELAEKEEEEALSKMVMSLTCFSKEALLAALTWLCDHKIVHATFLCKRVKERKQ